jgi:hypothetical protein
MCRHQLEGQTRSNENFQHAWKNQSYPESEKLSSTVRSVDKALLRCLTPKIWAQGKLVCKLMPLLGHTKNLLVRFLFSPVLRSQTFLWRVTSSASLSDVVLQPQPVRIKSFAAELVARAERQEE